MSSRYKGRAGFALVYVDTGHPEPPELWERAGGDGPPDRATLVARGAALHGLDFPCLLDTPDEAARAAYRAYPIRLVILDTDGRVGFDSGSSMRSGRLDTAAAEAWLEAHTGPQP